MPQEAGMREVNREVLQRNNMTNDNSLNNEPTRPDHEPVSLGDMPTIRSSARRFKTGELILGRYRIAGELGQGGMGIVYRCHDEIGGIDVALKALPPELSHNSVEMEEVRENFKLVSRLAHPNIATVRTLEKDPANGDFYLIMECVEGINLRQWRKKQLGGCASLSETLPIVHQVAAALDYAHSQKIIHRDIKPSNVMVAEQSVKVLDFGLAAQIHTSMSRVSQVSHGTSGTGPYMAPEQWRGQYQDAATDQYALAVMIYELLSGRPPFESHDPTVLRGAVLEEKVPNIGNISSNGWKVLERALARDRKERFSSCMDFVEALSSGKNLKPRNTQKSAKKIFGGVCALVVIIASYLSYSSYQSYQAEKAQRDIALTEQAGQEEPPSDAWAAFDAYQAEQTRQEEQQLQETKLANDREDAKKQEAEVEISRRGAEIAKAEALSGSVSNDGQKGATENTVPRRIGKVQLQQLESDRIAARVEMLVEKARYEHLDAMSVEDFLTASGYLEDDPFVDNLRTQIRDYDVALSSLLENYGPNHPEAKQAAAARDELMEKLAKALEGIKKGTRAQYIVAKAKFDALEEELCKENISYYLEKIRQNPEADDYRELVLCYAQINESGKAVVFMGQAASLYGEEVVKGWLDESGFDGIRKTPEFRSFADRIIGVNARKAAEPQSERRYTVQPGDSLIRMANQFGVSVESIRQANNLSGNLVYPGTKLIIPDSSEDEESTTTNTDWGGALDQTTEPFVVKSPKGLCPDLELKVHGNILKWNATPGYSYNIYWASDLTAGFKLLAANQTSGVFIDAVERGGFYKLEAMELLEDESSPAPDAVEISDEILICRGMQMLSLPAALNGKINASKIITHSVEGDKVHTWNVTDGAYSIFTFSEVRKGFFDQNGYEPILKYGEGFWLDHQGEKFIWKE